MSVGGLVGKRTPVVMQGGFQRLTGGLFWTMNLGEGVYRSLHVVILAQEKGLVLGLSDNGSNRLDENSNDNNSNNGNGNMNTTVKWEPLSTAVIAGFTRLN